ncbi:MAG TPA: MFS transporter [Nocardioidaceae bacterium]|nr:MFS transporter [Nocardioidaceae bacterium]
MTVEAPPVAYSPVVLEAIETVEAVALHQVPGADDVFPRRWVGLAAILAATLMNLLDSTVSNIAAPSIQASLGGSSSTLQWIAAGYTLALAVGLLVGGRLGDMFGRKRMFMVGVAGFVVSSAACAFAWSPESLIGARAIQGAFGALMIPQCFGLIRDMFGREMGKAFAAFGPAIGLATIIGPVVGGLLIEWDVFDLGWRTIFAINLPLGAVAAYVGMKVLPSVEPTARGSRLDVVGAAVAGLGMLLLVYPLVAGHEAGWPTWSYVALAAAVPVFASFVIQQRRRAASGRTGLVELSVFKKRSYVSGVAFVVAFFGSVVGFGLAVGLFLQLGLGYDALDSSLTQLTWPVGAFVGTAIGATLMNKLGRTILHIGLSIMVVGLVGLFLVFSADAGFWVLAAPMFAYGAGMGMIFIPLYDIIVADLDDHEVGSASGILESLQQLGASLGVAVLGTVFFSVANVENWTDVAASVDAAKVVTVLAGVLTAVAFAIAFWLPKKAKEQAW